MAIGKSVTAGGVLVLRVQGKLVAAGLDDLRRELEGAGEGSRIVLNLKGVHLIDSVAVGLLVQRHGALQRDGGVLVLCDVHPSVTRMLAMADLDRHFTIFEREAEAAASLAALPQPPAAPRKRGRKPKPRPEA